MADVYTQTASNEPTGLATPQDAPVTYTAGGEVVGKVVEPPKTASKPSGSSTASTKKTTKSGKK